jgi:type I restriction enzyme, S subunit
VASNVKNIKSRKVKFGDVVRLSKARCADPLVEGVERFVGLEHLERGDLRIRSWGNVADGVTFTSVFKPGQVLFGKRRAYQRKVAVTDFSGVCSGDIYVFESIDAKVLLPELLSFICQTDAFFDHAVGTSAGSLSPRTNWTSLADFEFLLPPIDEQLKFYKLLSSVRELKEVAESLVESLCKLRESLAFDAWTGNHGWPEMPLGNVCDKIQDGTHFSPKTTEGEFRYVTSKNIKDGYIDLTDCGWISKEEHEDIYRRCNVQRGDVLLTKDGANTSNVAINSIEEPFSLLSSVALLRPGNNLHNCYLFEFLRSKLGKQRIVSQMSGTAIPRVTLRQIKSISIPLAPKEKQEEIVHKFSEIEKSLSVAQKQLENAETMYRLSVAQVAMEA